VSFGGLLPGSDSAYAMAVKPWCTSIIQERGCGKDAGISEGCDISGLTGRIEVIPLGERPSIFRIKMQFPLQEIQLLLLLTFSTQWAEARNFWGPDI